MLSSQNLRGSFGLCGTLRSRFLPGVSLSFSCGSAGSSCEAGSAMHPCSSLVEERGITTLGCVCLGGGGSINYFVKGQVVSFLGFVSHRISVATTQLRHYSTVSLLGIRAF